jgi:metal-responsive CopG/Arc/MetJ family transcriptional regulator
MITLYDDIMRTIVDIPEQDIERLTEICRREGISRAEAVRRAVALYLARQAAGSGDRAFGLWRGREGDALGYEDEVRKEWE